MRSVCSSELDWPASGIDSLPSWGAHKPRTPSAGGCDPGQRRSRIRQTVSVDLGQCHAHAVSLSLHVPSLRRLPMSPTWILVADSARARLFEADGAGALNELACYANPEGRAGTRGLTTDRP